MSLVAHDNVRTIFFTSKSLVLGPEGLVRDHQHVIVARRRQELVDHAFDRFPRGIRQRHALDPLRLVVGLRVDPLLELVLPVLY